MRVSFLVILSLALLAAPAAAQDLGMSVRIIEPLKMPELAVVTTALPMDEGTARFSLGVKRGWAWSVSAYVDDAPLPLDVRVCRSGRCERVENGGFAVGSGDTLMVDYRGRDGESSSGTLTYLVAPV
ncbi:MAG TPA: hypothetical protein VMK65_03540 [Longimicrobiales bacterium]|nr:hypothetical protein [Longimicrobiales bacterium]